MEREGLQSRRSVGRCDHAVTLTLQTQSDHLSERRIILDYEQAFVHARIILPPTPRSPAAAEIPVLETRPPGPDRCVSEGGHR